MYKVENAYFDYDSNQWSTDYYVLSKTIIAFKSLKNFKFENCKKTHGIGRHKDMIEFHLGEQSSRMPWIYVASQKFDSVLIRNEFENSKVSLLQSNLDMAQHYEYLLYYIKLSFDFS